MQNHWLSNKAISVKAWFSCPCFVPCSSTYNQPFCRSMSGCGETEAKLCSVHSGEERSVSTKNLICYLTRKETHWFDICEQRWLFEYAYMCMIRRHLYLATYECAYVHISIHRNMHPICVHVHVTYVHRDRIDPGTIIYMGH